VTKLSLILPVFLFLFINVFGQTDSNAAMAAKDTVKDSNAVRTGSGLFNKKDSPGMKNDSPARLSKDTVLRVRKPLVKKPVVKDTVNNATSAVKDSLANSLRGGQATDLAAPVATAAVSVPVSVPWKGPDEYTLMKRTLATNPVFNFLGKPVAEKFELHRPDSKDTLFYLLLGILFYFALIRIFFEKYFNNLLTLFFRVSLRQQQIREQVLQTPLPSLLLNGLFIFTAGLYACNLLHDTPFGRSIGFWILYLDCMVLLAIIYLVKFLVLKFCGWVFNISRATDIYIFIVFLVNKIVGIFLLPFLILITFSGPEMRDILITISLTMIFVLLCYRVFASYRPVRNEIKLTPFHFFLYLCAFEIAPLLLIYKVLLAYLEKPY
jgi:uncharacterized protein DUF4271